jgi:hypothetical protein
MALEVFTDAVVLFGQWNLSGDSNDVKVERKVDMKESTRWGATEHRFQAGLMELEASGKGMLQFDDSATPKAVDYFYTTVGTEKVMTIAASRADGATAYLGNMISEDRPADFKVGEFGMFDFKFKCAGQHTRGIMGMPLTSRTATGNGTIYQLGALTSVQKMLAALHVTEFVGTSLDVIVYSNDTNNTTTPTARITFTQATGMTAEFKEVAGAITDTYWYVGWTFVGTSFKAAVSLGVR